MIQFVQATSLEAPTVLSFMEAFYSIDSYEFNKARARVNVEAFIGNERLGRLWLLKSGCETIGYLALTFGFSFEYGGRDAFIDEFYLEEAFRNRGFGSAILKQLDVEARALEVKTLHLEVEPHNEKGNRVYMKAGFGTKGRTLMSKKL